MARETTQLWAEIQTWLDSLRYPPTQAKLAELLGLKSRTVISDWKYGASRPTPEHLEALGNEMEMSLGPEIHLRLATAVMRDMGYAQVTKIDRHGNVQSLSFELDDDKHSPPFAGRFRNILKDYLDRGAEPGFVAAAAGLLHEGNIFSKEDLEEVVALTKNRTLIPAFPRAARSAKSVGRAKRVQQDQEGEESQDPEGG